MKKDFRDGTLTIFLKGHVDSGNAAQTDAEINEIIEECQPASLVLDFEELEYISSAGLRVILKLRKKFDTLSVINVQMYVYEILDMTGFTEIVSVEKAYRTFSVEDCELIGEGANGMVYRVSPETIVKVYKNADALDEIKREKELSRTAFVLGIPTAIPYDIVKVGDSFGSVFELLNAKSLDELLREDENNLDYVVEQSVEIMKIIHSTKAPDNLPYQRDTALAWVEEVRDYFTKEQHQKLCSLIDNIPENGMIMHGDLHIKNMMVMDGETLLIDMDTLSTGHPIYELAFIFNAYKGFGVTDLNEVEKFLRIPAATAYRLWRRTIARYFDTDDQAFLDRIEEKASLIGYLRVMRRVLRLKQQDTEKGAKTVSACHDIIAGLLEKLDELAF